MLGYVTAQGQGVVDDLLRAAAERLAAENIRLAGAVQSNVEFDPRYKCRMDLNILSNGQVIRISQDLGALAQGCRLDPDGLERAVGLVEAALDGGPDLLIINKFGKQELGGRGFRPVIGRGVEAGVPVIVGMKVDMVQDFETFAGDFATQVQPHVDAIVEWCLSEVRGAPRASD